MFVIATIALLTGCQSAHVAKPVVSEISGSTPDAQMEFWHTLATRSLTSNDDALHGMLLFLDEKDDCASYSDRVSALKQRRLLPGGFNSPPDEAVRRGTVAVMFAKTLGLRGGWAMHVFGATPRYALRELQYLAIFPYSSPQQTFSGTEFVGVIGALEDYQNAHEKGAKPAIPTGPTAPQTPAAPSALNRAVPTDLNGPIDLTSAAAVSS